MILKQKKLFKINLKLLKEFSKIKYMNFFNKIRFKNKIF